MKVHNKTQQWALEGLEQGRITKNEFDVAFFGSCKVDWDTMEVRAYSAAQVCRFYGPMQVKPIANFMNVP